MHTLTALYIRPNESIPWFREYCLANGNSYYNDYIQENFLDKGIMTQFTRQESEDKLLLTTEIKLTEEGLEKWLTDSIVVESRTKLFDYNQKNNITLAVFNMD